MKNKFYSFENITEKSADIYIYGDIVSYEWDESDVSAFGFKKELDELGDISELNVHINSLGGSTYQALTIYNLLKQNKAKINVYIDGIAASAASIVAMAGEKVYMPKTAMMMIHNCWTWATGNAKELRKTADDMDKIAIAYKAAYLSKINIEEEKLDILLDEETYLTAEECIEMGFADELIKPKKEDEYNQYSTMCIQNLVCKIKNQSKREGKISLDEKSIEKISNNIISILENKIKKEVEEKTPNQIRQENNLKPIKEDSWKSFFNTKKYKEGE